MTSPVETIDALCASIDKRKGCTEQSYSEMTINNIDIFYLTEEERAIWHEAQMEIQKKQREYENQARERILSRREVRRNQLFGALTE